MRRVHYNRAKLKRSNAQIFDTSVQYAARLIYYNSGMHTLLKNIILLLSLLLITLTTEAQIKIPRTQVIEEATGTWCGWCVRGIVGMSQLEELYPDSFIGLAIHGDDAYTTDSYNSFLLRISGYPFALINRSYSCGTKPEEMRTAYEAMANLGDAEGEAKIVNAHYTDAKYSAVEVNVETRFAKSNSNVDYRLAFVVVEDSIRDRQANFYSGGANGEMGGFESLSDNPYIYLRHVVRYIDCYDGIPGSVPTKITAGKTYTYTHTITMPKVKTRRRVSLVVLLLRDQGVSIVNASRYRNISPYIPEGICSPEFNTPDDLEASVAPTHPYTYDLQGRPNVQPSSRGIHIINHRPILNMR